MATTALSLSSVEVLRTRTQLWRGLFLREWWAHRPVLAIVGTVYALSPAIGIMATFMLPGLRDFDGNSSYSPQYWHETAWLWTYAVGVALAIVLGFVLGGAETTAGLEEGSLSLPPTRAQRFWARFGFAGSLLLGHATLNTIALIVLSTALPRNWLVFNPIAWLFIAWIAPLAIFCLAWTASVNGGPRRRLLMAFCLLALMYLTVSFGGAGISSGFNGFGRSIQFVVFAAVILGWTIWMLWLSYRIYCTREVHALQDS